MKVYGLTYGSQVVSLDYTDRHSKGTYVPLTDAIDVIENVKRMVKDGSMSDDDVVEYIDAIRDYYWSIPSNEV